MSPFSLIPRFLMTLKAVVTAQVEILLSAVPLSHICPSAIVAENGGCFHWSGSPGGHRVYVGVDHHTGLSRGPLVSGDFAGPVLGGFDDLRFQPVLGALFDRSRPISDSSPVTLLVWISLCMKEISRDLVTREEVLESYNSYYDKIE